MVGSLISLAVLFGCFAVAETQGCYMWGNVYEHGEVFSRPGVSECLKYRCNNSHVGFHEYGCNVNGTCHPVGTSFDINCITHTCTLKSRTTSGITLLMRRTGTRTMGCNINGTCVNRGASITVNCITYKCRTAKTDAGDNYRLHRTNIRCKDYYGVCHDSNTSGLTRQLHGVLHTNCTCQAFNENGTVRFTCNQHQVTF